MHACFSQFVCLSFSIVCLFLLYPNRAMLRGNDTAKVVLHYLSLKCATRSCHGTFPYFLEQIIVLFVGKKPEKLRLIVVFFILFDVRRQHDNWNFFFIELYQNTYFIQALRRKVLVLDENCKLYFASPYTEFHNQTDK